MKKTITAALTIMMFGAACISVPPAFLFSRSVRLKFARRPFRRSAIQEESVSCVAQC